MSRLTDLKESHDAMARYLIHLCRIGDEQWNGQRTDSAEKNYQRARQLIEQAGFKYEPKKKQS